MLSKNPLTINDMNEILNKPLYFYESGRLNVSNIIDPDDLDFLMNILANTMRKLFIMSMIGLCVQIAIFQ